MMSWLSVLEYWKLDQACYADYDTFFGIDFDLNIDGQSDRRTVQHHVVISRISNPKLQPRDVLGVSGVKQTQP